jgi:receptor protein-tyrosine kinase
MSMPDNFPSALEPLNINSRMLDEIAAAPYASSGYALVEEFRTLRNRLNHLQTLQPLRTLAVTSPAPGEGKTFTALNLTMAQSEVIADPVLLVDCDIERPQLHEILQVRRAPGLTDFLTGHCALSEAMRRFEDRNVFLLPSGSPVHSPFELLHRDETKALFEQLARVFAWCIIDTPPVLFSPEARLVSSMADGTVLVVKMGSTAFDDVTRAMECLAGSNMLGVVANSLSSKVRQ